MSFCRALPQIPIALLSPTSSVKLATQFEYSEKYIKCARKYRKHRTMGEKHDKSAVELSPSLTHAEPCLPRSGARLYFSQGISLHTCPPSPDPQRTKHPHHPVRPLVDIVSHRLHLHPSLTLNHSTHHTSRRASGSSSAQHKLGSRHVNFRYMSISKPPVD